MRVTVYYYTNSNNRISYIRSACPKKSILNRSSNSSACASCDLIDRLQHDPMVDQLRIRRLKKRKLLLKDMITALESELIPDLDA